MHETPKKTFGVGGCENRSLRLASVRIGLSRKSRQPIGITACVRPFFSLTLFGPRLPPRIFLWRGIIMNLCPPSSGDISGQAVAHLGGGQRLPSAPPGSLPTPFPASSSRSVNPVDGPGLSALGGSRFMRGLRFAGRGATAWLFCELS